MSAPDPALPMDIVREVGIVLARRALDNPWIDHLWSPHGVLFPVPDCAAGELLSEEGDVRLVFAGAATGVSAGASSGVSSAGGVATGGVSTSVAS